MRSVWDCDWNWDEIAGYVKSNTRQVPILGHSPMYKDKVLPKVKKVIFNMPATIIIWADDTKTVVKCQSGDEYDCEKGFVMAYLKKLLGNDNTFNKEINKWVWNG